MFLLAVSVSGEPVKTFHCNSGRVLSVAVSPDGKYVAGMSLYHLIVWDRFTGREIMTIGDDFYDLSSVAFSPDGQFIAGHGFNEVKIYHLATGKIYRALEGKSSQIYDFDFSPDGRNVAACNASGNIQIWNIADGTLVKEYQAEGMSFELEYSPDGEYLACNSNKLEIWNLDTDAHRTIDAWIQSLAFSPDGKTIAGALDNIRTIKEWDYRTGELIKTYHPLNDTDPFYTSKCIYYSPDGTYLLNGNNDGFIYLWNAEDGKPLSKMKNIGFGVHDAAFLPEGGYVLTAGDVEYGEKGRVYMWEMSEAASAQADVIVHVAEGVLITTLSGHTDRINSLAVSADSKFLASGSSDGTIKIWDINTGRIIRTLELVDKTGIRCVAFSPDGESLLAVDGERYLTLWNYKTGSIRGRYYGYRLPLRAAAFSPDGQFIAAGGEQKVIHRWFLKHGDSADTWGEYDYYIGSIAYSPDGKYIAAGINEIPELMWDNRFYKSLKLWDAETGELIRTLEGHKENCFSLDFSPDGRYLVSGGFDSLTGKNHASIKIFDLQDGRLVQAFTDHKNTVKSVAFSPGGKYIASASDLVRIWDWQSGNTVRIFPGHDTEPRCVAFSPDGKYLASGDDSGVIKIWDVEFTAQ